MGGIDVETRLNDRKSRGSIIAEKETQIANDKRHAVAEALILKFTQHLYN